MTFAGNSKHDLWSPSFKKKHQLGVNRWSTRVAAEI